MNSTILKGKSFHRNISSQSNDRLSILYQKYTVVIKTFRIILNAFRRGSVFEAKKFRSHLELRILTEWKKIIVILEVGTITTRKTVTATNADDYIEYKVTWTFYVQANKVATLPGSVAWAWKSRKWMYTLSVGEIPAKCWNVGTHSG